MVVRFCKLRVYFDGLAKVFERFGVLFMIFEKQAQSVISLVEFRVDFDGLAQVPFGPFGVWFPDQGSVCLKFLAGN